MNKACSICKETKESHAFNRRSASKDGLSAYCKKCHSEKERNRKASKKEEIDFYEKFHRKEVPSRDKEYSAKRYKEWAERNRANINERNAVNQRLRRERIKVNGGTFTQKDIENLLIEQNFQCFYCKDDISKKWQTDHFIPIVNGGSNSIENIRLCCSSCNSRKGIKMPTQFMILENFNG